MPIRTTLPSIATQAARAAFAAIVSLVVFNSAVASDNLSDSSKHIVLIAGNKSHEPGAHEYLKSVKLLKVLLDDAPNVRGIHTEIFTNGWATDPRVLDRADAIAFFSDGDDNQFQFHSPFLTSTRMKILSKQMKRGCGFLLFHFSTFASQKYAREISEWNGAYFDHEGGHGEGGLFGIENDEAHRRWHSAIRVAEADVIVTAPNHPVTEGVSSFHLKEEFYYRLTFLNETPGPVPILRVPELAPAPLDQVVAWALERKDGGRGFGTTLGHFFENWRNDSFRRLILNALIWTAGSKVPKGGVESTYKDEQQVNSSLMKERVCRARVDPGASLCASQE